MFSPVPSETLRLTFLDHPNWSPTVALCHGV